MLLHLVAQSLDGLQAHGIFLCGDDASGRGEAAECLVDELDILLLELMVISECQRFDLLGIRLQVESHLLRQSNTCQQQHMLVSKVLELFKFSFTEKRFQMLVGMC